MEQLIKIWKDVWDEEFDDNQNYQRYFRLIEDILKEINKNGDESFIKDTFAISRSLNVVAKNFILNMHQLKKFSTKILF